MRAAARLAVVTSAALLAAGTALSGIDLPLTSTSIPVRADWESEWLLADGRVPVTPLAIDVHPSGVVWGIATERRRVFSAGKIGDAIQFSAGGEGDFTPGFPDRIFARSGLNVFTLDPWEMHLERLDLTGYREARISLTDALAAASERLGRAADFCLSRSGELYVLDAARARILAFDATGAFQRALGEAQIVLREPVAIDIDGHGRLYVLEANPPALARLDPNAHASRRALAAAGDASGVTPPSIVAIALAVDPWGNAFIADRATGRVLVVPADGSSDWWIGDVERPLHALDLAVDGVDRLLIADSDRRSVMVYRLTYRHEAPAITEPAPAR
jgi:hypothetical protein